MIEAPRELLSSESFSVEYRPDVKDQELRDDILSYLAEFRFQLPKYDYDLVFSHTDDEGWKLRDPHRLEAMGIKAERSITERLVRGESVDREVSEAIGISSLEDQLETANEGETVIWASPPGTKEEGYGDYGFFFVGQIRRSMETRKDVQMTAVRVEHPTIGRFNQAFSILTDIDFNFTQAEDFLRSPVLVRRDIDYEEVDAVLSQHFSPYRDPESAREIFETAKRMMASKIETAVQALKWGTNNEKREIIHALENYSLELKGYLEEGIPIFDSEIDFGVFISSYGYEPPKVAGSCPIKSANILNQGLQSLDKILGLEKSDKFTCPNCGITAEGSVGNQCPGCKITKEEWAKKSKGKIC